jgi:hypothetical protein
VLHAIGVEPQQVADRCRGRQRARGAGGVKDLVVRSAEELADADADLVARHHGGEQLAARASERLGHGQRGREHHGRRVEHRAVVHVVLLGEVRRGRVDHGGEQRARAPAGDQHLRAAVERPHRAREGLDRLDRARTLAGQCRAEPVGEEVFGARDDGGRDGAEAQVGREGGKGSGLVHVRHIASAARRAAMSSVP